MSSSGPQAPIVADAHILRDSPYICAKISFLEASLAEISYESEQRGLDNVLCILESPDIVRDHGASPRRDRTYRRGATVHEISDMSLGFMNRKITPTGGPKILRAGQVSITAGIV
jgi:hypothetical protein